MELFVAPMQSHVEYSLKTVECHRRRAAALAQCGAPIIRHGHVPLGQVLAAKPAHGNQAVQPSDRIRELALAASGQIVDGAVATARSQPRDILEDARLLVIGLNEHVLALSTQNQSCKIVQ